MYRQKRQGGTHGEKNMLGLVEPTVQLLEELQVQPICLLQKLQSLLPAQLGGNASNLEGGSG